ILGVLMSETILPSIRTDLEFLPGKSGDDYVVVVRDELELNEGDLVLQQEIIHLLSFFDGANTASDVQTELTRLQGGVLFPLEEIKELCKMLDGYFLLDTDNFRNARAEALKEYSSLSIRKAAHAGQAYPEDKKELSTLLDSILKQGVESDLPQALITGIAAPHIDISVGARVYGSVYRTIKGLDPELVVILGIGHKMQEGFFSLTEKDFETPLGTVKTRKEAVKKCIQAGGNTVCPDDFTHKKEHSIEFQLLFLQHVLKSNFEVIPILCGNASAAFEKAQSITDIPGVSAFIDALKEELSEAQEKTLVVAGVDLSHIGLKFGQEKTGREQAEDAETHDWQLLNHFSILDSKAFWNEVKQVDDIYNVCGFSALSCMIELVKPGMGTILDYDMWHEEPTESAVSFPGVVFLAENR
ncbi:AmmeMemoRadiSam system protein B, partial [Planctomycetota bacterium]